ncbi:MAG: hypothetical protein ACOYMG_24530 [Candidatus Methylumidiphilus sp.]
MHTIQFDAHTEAALTQRAAMAGKDSDQLIKDVVSEYLAEQVDTEQADAAYSRYLAGQEGTVSLDNLERFLN